MKNFFLFLVERLKRTNISKIVGKMHMSVISSNNHEVFSSLKLTITIKRIRHYLLFI